MLAYCDNHEKCRHDVLFDDMDDYKHDPLVDVVILVHVRVHVGHAA